MKVRSSQKGFTFVEILAVMAVGGLLLSGIIIAIFQTTGITAESSTQITALEDIKNVAYWVSKDVKMAATTNLIAGATPVHMNNNYNLVLDWTIWYDANGNLIPNGEPHHSE